MIELFSHVHCRCVVPTIKVNTPMLTLGRCFLQHPYRCHVELSNDTDLPAKYVLLPGSAADILDSLTYTSPQPEVCATVFVLQAASVLTYAVVEDFLTFVIRSECLFVT